MAHRQDLRIRDPFVYVQDGWYYLLGTTGNDTGNRDANLLLYQSRDLESFRVVGPMVPREHLEGYRQIWAPELHCHGGKYYLIVSLFREDLGRGSMIFASERLAGPYAPLTGQYITPAGKGCLDATLFSWQGRPWLYYSYEWTTPEGDGAVYVAPLSGDLKTLAGEPKRIIDGKTSGIACQITFNGHRGYVAEGPFARQEDGGIALYWSTFTPQGYCVAKHTARDILEDYRFEKMIFQKDGGHCMVFTDLQGQPQLALHQPNTPPMERMRLFPLEQLPAADI